MGKTIKTFSDGSLLEYDRGSFDDMCVYYTDENGNRKPPRDTDYFNQLKALGKKYGDNKVYSDYVNLYEKTGTDIDDSVFDWIHDQCVSSYPNEGIEVEVMFCILYMAMIAEEKKANTKLGKRIKRLGIHNLLIEGKDANESASFMKGMKWREIHDLCVKRGF